MRTSVQSQLNGKLEETLGGNRVPQARAAAGIAGGLVTSFPAAGVRPEPGRELQAGSQ